MALSKVIVYRFLNFSMDDVIGSYISSVACSSLETMMPSVIFSSKLY